MAALFVLAAPGETDEHAVNQLINKAAISATTPRQPYSPSHAFSCSQYLYSSSYSSFFKSPRAGRFSPSKASARSAAARFRISLTGMGCPSEVPRHVALSLIGSLQGEW